MNQLDDTILDTLLNASKFDEQSYSDAAEDIERYQDKIRIIKMKVDSEIDELDKDIHSTPGPGSIASINDHISRRKFLLPKIELRKYSGEKIHKDDELDDYDKFHYLKQCMNPGTRAHRLVSSYPETRENYLKVIKALCDRFVDLLRVWQRSPNSSYDEEKPVKSEERLPALLKFLRGEIKDVYS
ncbi:hypothetical protein FQR65_LT11171 [Abscondita terminalis]|nr:hypothetical protein FQR65_LT11171 [Abscondita terminalis]